MKVLRYVSLLILISVLAACGGQSIPTTGDKVRVGSTDAPEDQLIAEVYSQVLEANGIPVERKLNLAGKNAAHNALINKQIDLYPEYTNNAYLSVMEMKDNEQDPGMIREKVHKYYQRRWKIAWLDAAGTTDPLSPVVWQDVLDRYPQMAGLLNTVSKQLTPDVIASLNAQLGDAGSDYAKLARGFLDERGLLP